MIKVWRVKETSQVWIKTWNSYERDGKCVGAMIIVENGSPELIEAIKRAFMETEGKKAI